MILVNDEGQFICIDEEGAKLLDQNIVRLQTWIDESWAQCGEKGLEIK